MIVPKIAAFTLQESGPARFANATWLPLGKVRLRFQIHDEVKMRAGGEKRWW
jgi:hypothetical protein